MPRSIPKSLLATAARLPDKVALVQKGETITFGELCTQAQATAECLRELNIQPGDRVGICMEKSIDQALVFLGVLFANAVVVPILPRLKGPNIRHIIENSGMVAMVTDAPRLKEVREFADITKLIAGRGEVEDEWPNLAYLRRHLQPRLFFDRIGADNAAIIYSSGSTGRPKGILIGHRQLVDGAHIVADYLDTREDDRIGCILSFNFDYGLNQLWQTVVKGCTLYLHDFVLPNDFFSLVAKEKLTALPVMPVIISQMFDKRLKLAVSQYDLSSMRYVCTTGGRISMDMIDDLREAFPEAKIYSMFGLTEAFRATFLAPEKLLSHPTSIGKAIPGSEVLVLDDEGNECAPGVSGELVQRGATVNKGYWRNPEKTAKMFRTHPRYPGETLVYSGDDAVRDEEGYLYFVGRRDEMIKTRGFRVSPTEVEVEVLAQDSVDNAVAFAVANIAVGEDIACAYTTSNGEPIPEKVMMQKLKRTLPRHMVPAYFIHFDSFPITGNAGKLDRKSIKESAFERLGLNDKASAAPAAG
ncbi:MAG: AMP-binding protein [Gammaproteobacteria bacterium]